MSIIDTTILRIQVLANACTGIKSGASPAYPVDDASVLPMSIAHITGGNVTAVNATDTKLIVNISVDFHFDRKILRLTYQAIDALIPDFIQRLGGDPSLNGSASTIIFPVQFTVSPAEWDSIITQMVTFTIPVKFNLLTPTVTA
jgi:hypothetical protein